MQRWRCSEQNRRRSGRRILLGVVLLVGACSAHAAPDHPLRGARIVVVGSWSGAEQAHFEAVLAGFRRTTGVHVRYVSGQGEVPTLLTKLLARHDPPDVALLPQPGLLRDYARRHLLTALDAQTRAAVVEHYAPVWRRLASSGGRLYGVWFKAADKSLVWYSVGLFERAGVVPPNDLTGLLHVATRLRTNGIVPFSVGGADAWTLTDWFENIYLRTAGPQRYSALASHRLAWTDPTVTSALRLFRSLLRPGFLLGGTRGALRAGFEASVSRAFGQPPRAAMVMEGDFVAGVVTSRTTARLGTDVDAFAFPGSYQGLPEVVGGGDVAVQMRTSPAAAALLTYLASPSAAAIWARAGGFVSPNQDLDLAVYPNPLAQSIARAVIEAGDGFRFDLSDLQPGGFGSDPNWGMQAALRGLVRTGQIAPAQRMLESDANRVFGR